MRFVLPLALLTLSACGPNFTHRALVGEDPDVLAMIGAKPSDVSTPETVAAAQRFYRELWSDRTGDLWKLLSGPTRTALDTLAGKADTNGRSMLRSKEFPGPKGTIRVSLAALFMVRRPVGFEETAVSGDTDDTAKVLVRNRDGQRRVVELRRERGAWKVHQTDFSELPEHRDLRTKALPWELPTPVPEVPAPTEEAEDAAEEPTDEKPKPERAPDLDF